MILRLKEFLPRLISGIGILIALGCELRADGQESNRVQRVVILSGANFFIHTSLIQDQAMLQALMAGSKRQIEFNPEAMDMLRLPSAEYEVEYVAFLKKKYAATKMDLIIAVTSYALNFVERHRDTLWPGSPVVFYNVSEELIRNRAFKPGITGQTIAFDVRGTIELALRLQPEARRLVVVGGVADSDRYWVVRAAEQLRGYTGKVEAVYFTNQPVSQMIAELRQVGRDTIVLFTSTHRDTTGQTYVAQEILTKLSEVSGAPFYGFVANYLGAGIVGGSISSFEEQGRRAGQLALRVLDGENPDTIPVQPPPALYTDRGLGPVAALGYQRESVAREHSDQVSGALLLGDVPVADHSCGRSHRQPDDVDHRFAGAAPASARGGNGSAARADGTGPRCATGDRGRVNRLDRA